jgi:hypothetical protein
LQLLRFKVITIAGLPWAASADALPQDEKGLSYAVAMFIPEIGRFVTQAIVLSMCTT